MKEFFSPDVQNIQPNRERVFLSQGISKNSQPSDKIFELYSSAVKIFLQLAEPIGLICSISSSKFSEVYTGMGKNAEDTPLEKIYPKADSLALFVFTLGEKISQQISDLFSNKNFALGAMLDAVASQGTDMAAQKAENFFSAPDQLANSNKVLLYSPGYCGWHISGQKKLFEYLHPEQINIMLNEQYLMVPLKSISGVLVKGKAEIHTFKNNYPFCKLCNDHSCIQRMKQIKNIQGV